MRRSFRWEKKYLYWGVTAFCVIAACILFYLLLKWLPALGGFLSRIVGILSPFVWGLIISYLFAPMMKYLQKRMPKWLAVLICLLTFLLIIAALIYLIIPQLYSSLETIVTNSPSYIAALSDKIDNLFKNNQQLEEDIEALLGNVNTNLTDIIKNQIMPQLGGALSGITLGVVALLKGLYNLFVGIFVSVYILSNLEKLSAGADRQLYSVFSLEAAERIKYGVRFVDRTFMGFINGKLLDSFIIGVICYLFCVIVNVPYALLVSVIVGVTNIIPFFGPFIGAIPCVLIILMVDPLKCLIFIIFIIVLQQIDGNIIGPKILGQSIGINGFWVMFSIILGAGLFGFWGMLLGVPVFTCILAAAQSIIERKLARSDLPTEFSEYENLDYIDPETRELHYKKK